jgi:hypothetical protein
MLGVFLRCQQIVATLVRSLAIGDSHCFGNFNISNTTIKLSASSRRCLCIHGPLLTACLSIRHENTPRPPVPRVGISLRRVVNCVAKLVTNPILSSFYSPRLIQFKPTMSSTEGPLFSSELISPEVLKALPEGYSCRPLERKDYHNGFLDVLRVLTTVGDITEEV